eukprot:Gb_24298 [translate_table: standard]
MNRSSKFPCTAVQHRRGRSLTNVNIKDRDEDLALFHEMGKIENDRHSLLLNASDEFESRLANAKLSSSPMSKITAPAAKKGGSDNLLIADGDKNDYDWLLTPPGTPLFPSLEMEAQATGLAQKGSPLLRPATALKASRLSNPHTESSSKIVRGSLTSRQTVLSGLNSSTNTASGRSSMPLSTGPALSRPSTPTARSMAPASLRPSTPTARSTGSPSLRPSTPTSRSIVPASRPTVPASRPTVPATRSSSRSSTPTRRPSTPSISQNNLVPPVRSSSASKVCSMPSRNPAPSRGSSPIVRPRPSQPSLLPGFSLDAPPNLRTTMPERPASATRGRPGAPSSARFTTEVPNASSRPRRQSCSPSVTRGRISSESPNSDRSSFRTSKSYINGTEISIPVVLGSKIVEKVINTRSVTHGHEHQATTRPAISPLQTKRPVKSISTPDSSGFGRTLSKKSLDMALRHMDIRQSTPSSIRPLISIPTSSLYSVRSGPTKSRPTNISDSPIATSSNASSEHGACIAPYPEGSALDDYDFGTERESRVSPLSHEDTSLLKGDAKSTNWLHSPENKEDKFDQTLLFHQRFERLSESFDAIGVGADL